METSPSRLHVWAPRLLLAAVAVVLGGWIVDRTTWYLAIDQFGYLTFARDLIAGRVSHDFPLLDPLARMLPSASGPIDLLGQTYLLQNGGVFCRYAPGFPMILGAASLLFGPEAVHWVNLVAFVGLLGAVYALSSRLLDSEWSGLGAAVLTAVLPNYLLAWSMTPLRDVPAHALALGGLTLLVRSRAWSSPVSLALAGLLLGFTGSVRPDGVLYLLAVAGVWCAVGRPWERAMVAFVLFYAVGLAPVLAYNSISTGNPFRPTQSMEVAGGAAVDFGRGVGGSANTAVPEALAEQLGEFVATVVPGAGAAVAADPGRYRERPHRYRLLQQGGGLSPRNLPTTLPANLRALRAAVGDLVLALAALGALVSLRTPLGGLALPYGIVATVFFSMWTRPDPRYLSGVLILLPILAFAGIVWLCRRARDVREQRGWGGVSAGAAVVLAICGGMVWGASVSGPQALPLIQLGLAVGLPVAVVLAAGFRDTGPALALVGVGLAAFVFGRAALKPPFEASFQREEVRAAQANLDEVLGPKPVIITTVDVGRPAENINYYTRADAVYLRELIRWGVLPAFFLNGSIRAGHSVYLLLLPEQAEEWVRSRLVREHFRAELVRRVAPRDAARYFVAGPHHRGVPLVLVRMHLREGA